MKKILLIICLTLSFTKIYAYENEYFNLDIPEDYTLAEVENTYIWSKENSNKSVIITIADNSKTNYNIAQFTEDDVVSFGNYIGDSINSQLEEYNLEVSVNNIEKTMLNENDSILVTIFWPTEESYGYDTHQIGYYFSTENYIISLTYESDEVIESSNEEINNIINSFSIKDEPIIIEKSFLEENFTIIVISTFALIGLIIFLIFNKKKDKYRFK